jgi:hypothetical protein
VCYNDLYSKLWFGRGSGRFIWATISIIPEVVSSVGSDRNDLADGKD